MLGKILGGGAAQVVGAATDFADAVSTTDEERMAHHAKLAGIAQKSDAEQASVNRTEAQHRSLWVSGWRPGIGWSGVAGISWTFVLQPIVAWACAVWAPGVEPPPPVETGPLLTLVGIMIGNATRRTIEKRSGVAAV